MIVGGSGLNGRQGLGNGAGVVSTSSTSISLELRPETSLLAGNSKWNDRGGQCEEVNEGMGDVQNPTTMKEVTKELLNLCLVAGVHLSYVRQLNCRWHTI